MSSWHLTYSAGDDSALFTRESERRRVLRTLGRVVGDRLILFRLLDGQLDVAIQAPRARVGPCCSALTRALASGFEHPADPPYRREIRTRSHLVWLVGHLLSEEAGRDLAEHPALRTGSCFPDLVGARLIPGVQLALHEALPRLRPAELRALVGLPPGDLPLYDKDRIRAAGTVRLARAAAKVCCAPPDLVGSTAPVVRARGVTATLARDHGIHTIDVAWALRVDDRTVRRLGARRVDRATLDAALRHLALEDQVAARLGVPVARPPHNQPTAQPAMQPLLHRQPLWEPPRAGRGAAAGSSPTATSRARP